MKDGVFNSKCVIAVITGPCPNPDFPDEPEDANAFFKREFCLRELLWAKEAGIRILPVVRAVDKGRISEFMSLAPRDLQFISDIDFIALDRSDKDYWDVGVRKILVASGIVPTSGGGQHKSQILRVQPRNIDRCVAAQPTLTTPPDCPILRLGVLLVVCDDNFHCYTATNLQVYIL